MLMHIVQVLFLLFRSADSLNVPADPGSTYLNPKDVSLIEGPAVTVAHSGSKLPPIPPLKFELRRCRPSSSACPPWWPFRRQPHLPAFYQRLGAQGKPKMVALAALMRKLAARHLRHVQTSTTL